MFLGLSNGASKAAAGLPMIAASRFLGLAGVYSISEQRLASSLNTASSGIYGAELF